MRLMFPCKQLISLISRRRDKKIRKLIKHILFFKVVGVTHWMDGSFVYGSDDQLARSLRAFQGGLLQYEYRNGRIWPPANPNKTLVCQGQTSPDQPCYMTGI